MHLVETIKEQAELKPFLGICLGMQLLFDKSYEYGEHEGLGLIPGTVEQMKPANLDIPHMGWNSLEKNFLCQLVNGINNDRYVYFVHSYMAVCDKKYIAEFCEYGGEVPAIVVRDKIFGAQFHPEKSGDTGLAILKNFADLME